MVEHCGFDDNGRRHVPGGVAELRLYPLMTEPTCVVDSWRLAAARMAYRRLL